jgi:hypothetical protein
MANNRSSIEAPGVPMLSVFKGHAPPVITLIATEKKRREVGSSRRRNWSNRVNHTVGRDTTGFHSPCQGQSRTRHRAVSGRVLSAPRRSGGPAKPPSPRRW